MSTVQETRAEPAPDRVDFTGLIEWTRRRDPVRWALAAMTITWALVFIYLGWQRHDRFGTFGFDLGIYDQSVWLLSRFKDPFVTIRGLDFWGHHVNAALLLFVPFYWLGAGPQFLLVVQVAAQASGAVAVYLLARDLTGTRWPAVVLGGVLLLLPSYQFQTWWYFHPDALAIAPLLFAYWAARTKRWRWFVPLAVLAVLCKEDVALAMAVVGVLIAVRGDRRIGVWVTAASLLWFLVATRMIIPAANGIGPFYDNFFGEFGNSPLEVMGHVVTHPGKTLEVATKQDALDYYRMMFAPVAFLPLFALPTFLIAGPMLAVNVLSSLPYSRQIMFHYSSLVLAGTMLATVEAIARLGRNPGRRAFLVGLVAATSLAATVAWGPSPLSTKFRSGYWTLSEDSRQATREAAVALIPSRDAASVHYQYAPHMTHRTRIYEWPAPWKPANWGVRGENLDDPADVEWLLLDRQLLDEEGKAMLDELLAGEFAIRFERDGIVVAQRTRPPSRAAPS